ncbi:L-fucose:H+ symporter permease [Methylomonas sp. MgM2]
MKTPQVNESTYRGSLAILTSLFFIWGFITCLNDILIPHLKAVFALNYTEAMLIQFCFFTAYFVMSVPSGILVENIGYKGGIVTGLTIAGTGCLLFYPAAGLQAYPLFLTALFVLASGITLLQVAANPYVTVLGAPESASSRLTMTQAFNSLGTALAPFWGSLMILSVAVKSGEEIKTLNAEQLLAYRAAQAATVQYPYLLLAAALFLMALVFALLNLPKIETQSAFRRTVAVSERDSPWQHPQLVLGAIAIFLYVGGEVAIGSFMVNFLGEADIANLPEQQAGKYVSFYWGGAMLGRFAGALVLRKFKPAIVLTCHAMSACLFVLAAVLGSGTLAMWCLIAVGLCNSIMFPTIFALALTGLGKHTGQGSGILCMAIVGGAVIPVLQGMLADSFGVQPALTVPLACYAYIACYAWISRERVRVGTLR